jgi:hypothetical protein
MALVYLCTIALAILSILQIQQAERDLSMSTKLDAALSCKTLMQLSRARSFLKMSLV